MEPTDPARAIAAPLTEDEQRCIATAFCDLRTAIRSSRNGTETQALYETLRHAYQRCTGKPLSPLPTEAERRTWVGTMLLTLLEDVPVAVWNSTLPSARREP